MALDPEIQRIVLRDGPAVLGDPSTWPSANACVRSHAAQWIASSEDPEETSTRALHAVRQMLEGFRRG